MKSPAQYQHEVSELKCEEIKTDGLSEAEAKKTLETVTETEEKLRQIENGLNLDLHALRSQYQGRAASLNLQNQRRSGKARNEGEQRLEEERQSKLAPYEEVKTHIDQLTERLQQMRSELEKAAPGAVKK